MGFGEGVAAMSIMGLVSIALYLAVIYAIVFWIVLPALSIVARMFGFPG
jgi:hypothetical protein